MVKPIGHWPRIPFGTRSWISLSRLSRFQGIGFRILLRGLSSLQITLELVVPSHYLQVPVRRSFEFFLLF